MEDKKGGGCSRVVQIANIFQTGMAPTAVSRIDGEETTPASVPSAPTAVTVVRTESHLARFNNARALFEKLGNWFVSRLVLKSYVILPAEEVFRVRFLTKWENLTVSLCTASVLHVVAQFGRTISLWVTGQIHEVVMTGTNSETLSTGEKFYITANLGSLSQDKPQIYL